MSELVLVLGVPDYLSSFALFALRDQLTTFERQGFKVLVVDIEFASLVSEVVVADVLVLLFFLGLRHVSSLFEHLLVSKRLPSQHKLRIWTQLLNRNLAFLAQHSSTALDVDLKHVEMQPLVFSDAPANHNFECMVDLYLLEAVVHNEEVVN